MKKQRPTKLVNKDGDNDAVSLAEIVVPEKGKPVGNGRELTHRLLESQNKFKRNAKKQPTVPYVHNNSLILHHLAPKQKAKVSKLHSNPVNFESIMAAQELELQLSMKMQSVVERMQREEEEYQKKINQVSLKQSPRTPEEDIWEVERYFGYIMRELQERSIGKRNTRESLIVLGSRMQTLAKNAN